MRLSRSGLAVVWTVRTSSPDLEYHHEYQSDHTQFLGDTEEKIAAEKAGIIKKRRTCPSGGGRETPVFDLFQNEARKAGAPSTTP